MNKKLKIWCENCEGKGYFGVADYDWEENRIDDMEYECEECDGEGYTIVEEEE